MTCPLWIKTAWTATKVFALANGPTIMFVGGLVVGGIAIAHAIHDAVTKEPDELEDAIDDIHSANDLLKKNEATDDEREELKAAKKEAVKRFLKTAVHLYGKTLALALISAALLAGGFYWQSKRFAIASAAAASSAAIINTVDNNIRSLFGEEGVQAMHDPNFNAEEFKVAKTSDGTAEAVEKLNAKFKDHKPSGIVVPGDWIFKFSPLTAKDKYWQDLPRDNALMLTNAQSMLNRKLAAGYVNFVSINDALKEIGLDEAYATPAGNNFGWGRGDFVDFGLGELLARLQMVCDGLDVGQSRSDIWRRYGDEVILHFCNVRFLTDNVLRGGRDLEEVRAV